MQTKARKQERSVDTTVLTPMSATAAELLHRLQQDAADAVAPAPGTIVLKPHGAPRRYDATDTRLCAYFGDFYTSIYLYRHHGNGSAIWTGDESLVDASGTKWERRIRAVVNNFGDLVEVPA